MILFYGEDGMLCYVPPSPLLLTLQGAKGALCVSSFVFLTLINNNSVVEYWRNSDVMSFFLL